MMIAPRWRARVAVASAVTLLAPNASSALDLTPLDKWSRTMGVCARIVTAAASERPPPDHGVYLQQLKAAGPAGSNAAKPPAEPAHAAYVAFIDQKKQELADCGQVYRYQLKLAWPIVQELQKLDEAKVPATDPRYVAAARVRDASTALGKAIGSLSDNKLVEALLRQPLLEHFLRKPD